MNDELKPGDRVRLQNWPEEKDPENDANGRVGEIVQIRGAYFEVLLDVPPAWNSLLDGSGVYCLPSELVKL